MMYTREEYQNKLIPNAKAIEDFIKKEIQSCMVEEIKIPFGEMVCRGRYNEIRETKHCLYVRKDDIFGRTGGLTIYFDIPEYFKNTCGCIDVWNDYGYGGEFIYDLCLEWNRIKFKLLNAVESQNANRNKVLIDFIV